MVFPLSVSCRPLAINGNLRHQQVLLVLCIKAGGTQARTGSCCDCLSPPCWDRVFWIGLPPAFPSHRFFYFRGAEVCVMLAGPSYRVIDCCAPTVSLVRGPSIGAGAAGQPGWACMTCLQSVAPSPPSPPSPPNRPAAAKRLPGCCGYHLHALRASTRSGQTCVLECCYRAWHCLLPCLLSMRGQLGIFLNCQPPPLLPARDPSIPWTHINSCWLHS